MGVVGLDRRRGAPLGAADLADGCAGFALWLGWSRCGLHHVGGSLAGRRCVDGGGESGGLAHLEFGCRSPEVECSGIGGVSGCGGEGQEGTALRRYGHGTII